jgi:DNA-binding CsgD family transcriptional regulator
MGIAMHQMTNDVVVDEQLTKIVSALANGLIMIDGGGGIIWMDEVARRRINGNLQHPKLLLASDTRGSIDCVISTVQVPLQGRTTTFCVIQRPGAGSEPKHDLIAAVETIMSDSTRFTRAIIETLRAWRQVRPPLARSTELETLTHREREILALICDGKSDVEMSKTLNLSQNTIRNHVASLYRKIGVNRRGAAIIWARERALTHQEFMTSNGWGRFNSEKDNQ